MSTLASSIDIELQARVLIGQNRHGPRCFRERMLNWLGLTKIDKDIDVESGYLCAGEFILQSFH
jgi:hypothetical protein